MQKNTTVKIIDRLIKGRKGCPSRSSFKTKFVTYQALIPITNIFCAINITENQFLDPTYQPFYTLIQSVSHLLHKAAAKLLWKEDQMAAPHAMNLGFGILIWLCVCVHVQKWVDVEWGAREMKMNPEGLDCDQQS